MLIIGAGMAGCLAAIMNPKAKILEASQSPPDNHRAVLRFRSKEVANITGIPFREVIVKKGIWYDGEFTQPNPLVCNMYSQKVIGRISNRSIWNLDTVKRYVAPSNFHNVMLDMLSERIIYNRKIKSINEKVISFEFGEIIYRNNKPIISTMPMHVLAQATDSNHFIESQNFSFKEIYTLRGKVPDCDVHQTIYYPKRYPSIYRATLTGEDLIVESINNVPTDEGLNMVRESFGIPINTIKWDVENNHQSYGKIASIDDKIRRNFICEMTQRYNIYSLGRFGIWRNILLDDVADDIHIIKKLVNADNYEILRNKV